MGIQVLANCVCNPLRMVACHLPTTAGFIFEWRVEGLVDINHALHLLYNALPLCLLHCVTVIVIQDSPSDGIQDLHFFGRCHGKTLGNRLRLDGNPDALDSETSRRHRNNIRNCQRCITNKLNSCFDAADRIRLQGYGNPKASACICRDGNIRRKVSYCGGCCCFASHQGPVCSAPDTIRCGNSPRGISK